MVREVVLVAPAEVGHLCRVARLLAGPQLDDARGERGDELAVVRDEYQRPRVLVERGVERLDRLHLDMESIESLNTALDKYSGTLVFVSHDREFVSSLATRIIEIGRASCRERE